MTSQQPSSLELQSVAEREAALLAPYAMHSADSAGREHDEPTHAYRGPFQRDANRIVHSAAFRRLGHKTQVFTGELGDYHRTRLTHTMEVAGIARNIGRALRLSEDLIEALALLHDIGHPPFGHAGEDALDECLAQHGGFSHNRHALRIVELLEHRYHTYPGLNLSAEVLEGQRSRVDKHAGGPSPLLEVQVVDAADSIAYDAHDADDALELKLLTLEQLSEIPLWREAAKRAQECYPSLDPARLRLAVVHELIDWQVGDLLSSASKLIESHSIVDTRAARQSPPVIVPHEVMARHKAELESLLYDRVYRHQDVLRMRAGAQDVLRRLFDRYVAEPELMPASYRERIEQVGVERSQAIVQPRPQARLADDDAAGVHLQAPGSVCGRVGLK
ncbi:MAG: dNTP triphosphohydrolase [Planctomycetes bacterium]|nr:dNTP triphosphohydrolase [Planctomycetota bacterium]